MMPHELRKRLWVVLLCAGVMTVTAALAATPKEVIYDEMHQLADRMQVLKPSLGDSLAARTEYGTISARYEQLSQQLGGDDPGQVLSRSTSSRAQAPGVKVTPGVPPGLSGCIITTTPFTNDTDFAFTDVTSASSTVAVAVADTYVWDIDVSLSITHTFNGDIDMTLTSPGGTIVTLTTDNAGTNDNVFNGTLFDDDADPDGAVPYTTNNGMVTDQLYANLTLATPLVVEEALGAFIGENPNGTWTLDIDDDAGGDSGTLDTWTLTLSTINATPTFPPTVSGTNGTDFAFDDVTSASSTITITTGETFICDVNVTTAITHTFNGDIDMTLTSPAGTIVTLTTDNAGTNDNVWNGTLWDDDADPDGAVPYTTNNGLVTDQLYANLTLASPLVPEEALAAFIGENPNGTWTLNIDDDAGGDSGTLDTWTIDIIPCTCPVPVELMGFSIQ